MYKRQERQQPGLVSLQVDAGRRRDARRGKAVPGTEVSKGGFQLLDTRPPAAADAQHPDAGHQMQSVTGVDNVCERAAVLASGGCIRIPKQAGGGVTFALALCPYAPDWRWQNG